MRIFLILLALTGVGFGVAWSLGCCSSPGATSLPDNEGEIVVEGGDAPDPFAQPAPGEVPAVPAVPAVPSAPYAATPGPVTQPGELPPPNVVNGRHRERIDAPDIVQLPPGPGVQTAPDPASVAPPPTQPVPTQPVPTQPSVPTQPAAPETTPIPAEVGYSALTFKKVKGGRIIYAVPGTVDQVLAMLVDFENAAGNRPWAQSYRTISRATNDVVAEWKFKGKFGMNPTVHLRFRTTRSGESAVMKYALEKKAIGIASFFGDYKVEPLAGSPPRCRLTERVFIDSGIPFANASRGDIEKGLREDAKLIRAWMTQRAGR